VDFGRIEENAATGIKGRMITAALDRVSPCQRQLFLEWDVSGQKGKLKNALSLARGIRPVDGASGLAQTTHPAPEQYPLKRTLTARPYRHIYFQKGEDAPPAASVRGRGPSSASPFLQYSAPLRTEHHNFRTGAPLRLRVNLVMNAT